MVSLTRYLVKGYIFLGVFLKIQTLAIIRAQKMYLDLIQIL